MKAPKPQMRWISIVVLVALVAGVLTWRSCQPDPAAPPVAYVIPLEGAKVGRLLGSRSLGNPELLQEGAELTLTGGKVRLLLPMGVPVDLDAPAKRSFETRSKSEPSVLWSSQADLEKWEREGALGIAGKVAVRSPVGVTRFINPVIDWVAEDGKLYDVAVIDTEDALAKPRLTESVRPPIALADLTTTERRMLLPGRIYEVFVREKGKQESLGAGRVLVAAEAKMGEGESSPADLMTDAFLALRDRPYRTGDAYLAWNALPPAWQQSELGLRLRLALAAEYGETDQVQALMATLGGGEGSEPPRD